MLHTQDILKDNNKLTDSTDFFRIDVARQLDRSLRTEMGQFLTPVPISHLMVSMFENTRTHIRLLDAGAGVGSLTAAYVEKICYSKNLPDSLHVTAYEIEPLFIDYLKKTMELCQMLSNRRGIEFTYKIREKDFIEYGAEALSDGLFQLKDELETFNCAILNPPYRKIRSDSRERNLLRSIGIETTNLYSAFLSIVIELLDPGGEFVAITPRSFCNGPYFKPFRKQLLDNMVLRRIHVFGNRNQAFKEDRVLQENIIFHAIRKPIEIKKVLISSNNDPYDLDIVTSEVDYHEVVRKNDNDLFIHIVPDELERLISDRMERFQTSLNDLEISVSTGKVVDFRVKNLLRPDPDPQTVPLIYPNHIIKGKIKWPGQKTKKANAIIDNRQSENLLIPSDTYVLVKRFSSKEEKKRIVASVLDPSLFKVHKIGIENHLNYFHKNGMGISPFLARGLAAYLNSTLVDCFFRQFNGHTQVNATDLRCLKYPSKIQLEEIGKKVGDKPAHQDFIDSLIEEFFIKMPAKNALNPVKAKKKIEQALSILKDLGVPKEQQNERSALTLLSLLDLRPETPWAKSSDPVMGIRPMMDFFAEHYKKKYAENTRETVRRYTIHQFLQAGFVLQNPDDSSRPTNSPKNVYQINPLLLELLRTYEKKGWKERLKEFLIVNEPLKKQYAQERIMKRIEIVIKKGESISLSPGGQNVLVKKILDDFCPLFTPGAKVIYVGDTDNKWAYFDVTLLNQLGVIIEEHGKMTDVVVYYEERNWLVLIEAVTSHGPINPKRHRELKELFNRVKIGLVFVTAFLDRKTLTKYLREIAWETEVWVAESPTHLIHFNGERFLGPYDEIII